MDGRASGCGGGEALRLLLWTPDVTYQSNASRDDDIFRGIII